MIQIYFFFDINMKAIHLAVAAVLLFVVLNELEVIHVCRLTLCAIHFSFIVCCHVTHVFFFFFPPSGSPVIGTLHSRYACSRSFALMASVHAHSTLFACYNNVNIPGCAK